VLLGDSAKLDYSSANVLEHAMSSLGKLSSTLCKIQSLVFSKPILFSFASPVLLISLPGDVPGSFVSIAGFCIMKKMLHMFFRQPVLSSWLPQMLITNTKHGKLMQMLPTNVFMVPTT
jgi:hypothetical protein